MTRHRDTFTATSTAPAQLQQDAWVDGRYFCSEALPTSPEARHSHGTDTLPASAPPCQPLQPNGPGLHGAANCVGVTPTEPPAAIIPPMKRRLITLFNAGNLKISPLAPQRLQQRRLQATLQTPEDQFLRSSDQGPKQAPPDHGVVVVAPSNPEEGGGTLRRASSGDIRGEGCGDGAPTKRVCVEQPAPIPAPAAAPPCALTAAGTPTREVLTPSRLILRPIRPVAQGGAEQTFPGPALAGARSADCSQSPAPARAPSTPRGTQCGMVPVSMIRLPPPSASPHNAIPAAILPPAAAAAAGAAAVAAHGPVVQSASGEPTCSITAANGLCGGQPTAANGSVVGAREAFPERPALSSAGQPQQQPQQQQQQNAPPAFRFPFQLAPLDTLEDQAAGFADLGPAAAESPAARWSCSNPEGAARAQFGDGGGGGGGGAGDMFHHMHEAAAAHGDTAQEASVCMATFDPVAAAAAGGGLAAMSIEVTVSGRPKKGGGRTPRQRGGADDNDGYGKGSLCGSFDLQRYLEGRDCILRDGRWVSRSQFEKMGGSAMAKWYRSIRVLPDLEPLGEWLERHGMPVLRGPNRRSRKRPTSADSDDDDQWKPRRPSWQQPEPPSRHPQPPQRQVALPPLTAQPAAELFPLGACGDRRLSGGSGRPSGEAMMTALLATAAAAEAEEADAAQHQRLGEAAKEQMQQEQQRWDMSVQPQQLQPTQHQRDQVGGDMGQALRSPGSRAGHAPKSHFEGFGITRGGGAGATGTEGDEALVQRLLESWPLSQPFLRIPAPPAAAGPAGGRTAADTAAQQLDGRGVRDGGGPTALPRHAGVLGLWKPPPPPPPAAAAGIPQPSGGTIWQPAQLGLAPLATSQHPAQHQQRVLLPPGVDSAGRRVGPADPQFDPQVAPPASPSAADLCREELMPQADSMEVDAEGGADASPPVQAGPAQPLQQQAPTLPDATVRPRLLLLRASVLATSPGDAAASGGPGRTQSVLLTIPAPPEMLYSPSQGARPAGPLAAP